MARAARVLATGSLLFLAFCKNPPSTSPEQCNAMFEHYLDLRTGGVADAGAAALAKARSAARDEGRSDPDVVQVTSECTEEVTPGEVRCALAAQTVRAWNDCIN